LALSGLLVTRFNFLIDFNFLRFFYQFFSRSSIFDVEREKEIKFIEEKVIESTSKLQILKFGPFPEPDNFKFRFYNGLVIKWPFLVVVTGFQMANKINSLDCFIEKKKNYSFQSLNGLD
jgi:hypothetical protein